MHGRYWNSCKNTHATFSNSTSFPAPKLRPEIRRQVNALSFSFYDPLSRSAQLCFLYHTERHDIADYTVKKEEPTKEQCTHSH